MTDRADLGEENRSVGMACAAAHPILPDGLRSGSGGGHYGITNVMPGISLDRSRVAGDATPGLRFPAGRVASSALSQVPGATHDARFWRHGCLLSAICMFAMAPGVNAGVVALGTHNTPDVCDGRLPADLDSLVALDSPHAIQDSRNSLGLGGEDDAISPAVFSTELLKLDLAPWTQDSKDAAEGLPEIQTTPSPESAEAKRRPAGLLRIFASDSPARWFGLLGCVLLLFGKSRRR